MNLRIETENGQPKNHPALEGNILQAFGTIPAASCVNSVSGDGF
jgi:hypothetical protein